MRSRTVRFLGVLLLASGLLGAPAPPARATTLFEAIVVGATTVGGLGYPILTLTTETHFLTGSPSQTLAHLFDGVSPSSNCLTLPDGVGDDPFCLTNSHWTFDHVRSISMSSIFCLGASANIAKSKIPVAGPSCSFGSVVTPTLPNTISGHCGENSGQLTMRYTDGSISLTLQTQSFVFDVHFISTMGATAGGTMLLTGHVTKFHANGSTQRGLIVGLLDQNPPTPLLTSGQSCFNKTARDWVYSGVIVGYAT